MAHENNKPPFPEITFDFNHNEIQRHIERKIKLMVESIPNGKEKFMRDSTFNRCILSLAHGSDPLLIIDSILDQNRALMDELRKHDKIKVYSKPTRCAVCDRISYSDIPICIHCGARF